MKGKITTGDPANDPPVLSEDDIVEITGYTSPNKQLDVLKERGFCRAYRRRDGRIILERDHYIAVCRGEYSKSRMDVVAPGVNVAFLKRA